MKYNCLKGIKIKFGLRNNYQFQNYERIKIVLTIFMYIMFKSNQRNS